MRTGELKVPLDPLEELVEVAIRFNSSLGPLFGLLTFNPYVVEEFAEIVPPPTQVGLVAIYVDPLEVKVQSQDEEILWPVGKANWEDHELIVADEGFVTVTLTPYPPDQLLVI